MQRIGLSASNARKGLDVLKAFSKKRDKKKLDTWRKEESRLFASPEKGPRPGYRSGKRESAAGRPRNFF